MSRLFEQGAMLRWTAHILAAGVGLLALASPVRADTAVFAPARDATLIETANGESANGAGPVFFTGRTGQASGSVRRALILFDIAAVLPGGAWVTSAELGLVLTPSNSALVDVGLHRALSPWSEGPSVASGGSGAPAMPGDVTWVHTEYDTDFWSLPGGDFETGASGVTAVGANGTFVWASTPEIVDDVQTWLDAPASNHGWLLVGGEGAPSTAKRFASRENPTETMRPQLVVEYQEACEAAGLGRDAFGPCHTYCEILDCDGPAPRGSDRACSRLARSFASRASGAPLPCDPPDLDRDGVFDDAGNSPDMFYLDQIDGPGDDCDNCPDVPNLVVTFIEDSD